jgi:hypothetical protein
LLSERRIVANADETKLNVVDVAIIVCACDLIKERIVSDMVDLVEDNDDGSRETVEFILKKAIDFGLWMASFSDMMFGFTEVVYETDCSLVTRTETVAVDGGERNIDVEVFRRVLQFVEEKVRHGSLSDACLSINEDVVGISSIDDWLQCCFVLFDLVISPDDVVRYILYFECVPPFIERIVRLESRAHDGSNESLWCDNYFDHRFRYFQYNHHRERVPIPDSDPIVSGKVESLRWHRKGEVEESGVCLAY